jgi:hypothetical protein
MTKAKKPTKKPTKKPASSAAGINWDIIEENYYALAAEIEQEYKEFQDMFKSEFGTDMLEDITKAMRDPADAAYWSWYDKIGEALVAMGCTQEQFE